MRRYFYHAEISQACIEGHGVIGALMEAARRGDETYLQLAEWLNKNPDGRIVLSIGRDDRRANNEQDVQG